MDYVVTGGAGYIGGHLVDALVAKDKVTALDDLSAGNYINKASTFVKIDLADSKSCSSLEIADKSAIIHLAADPNVRTSMENIVEHFNRDVTTTLNALELARKYNAKTFVFSSSSVVYGEAKKIPTPESYKKRPISNYGVFKLMAELLVERYANDYGIKSTVLRFANVVGGRTSHGIIPDFINKLRKNSASLEILGDGKQNKSYIYIDDIINAITLVANKPPRRFKAFNVGNNDSILISKIAEMVCEGMRLKPSYNYVNNLDGRGWKGDVKTMLLDTKKIQKMGWKPTMSSSEAVRRAVKDLLDAKN